MAHYQIEGSRKAIRYGKEAVDLAVDVLPTLHSTQPENAREGIRAFFQLGEIHYLRNNFRESEPLFKEVKKYQDIYSLALYTEKLDEYLGGIATWKEQKSERKTIGESLQNIKIGEAIGQASKGISGQKEITLGEISEKNDDFSAAITHYEKAIGLFRQKGSEEKVNDLQLRIAVLLEKLEKHSEAQVFLDEALEELDDDQFVEEPDFSEISVAPPMEQDKERTRQLDSMRLKKEDLKKLSEQFAQEQNFEKSLSYYKLYQALSEEVKADSVLLESENLRKAKEITLLKQQKQIADLNAKAAEDEKEKLTQFRNTALLIALLIFIGSLVSVFFYLAKRKQHRKLTIAYKDLDKTKGKLVSAEKRITKLLTQQVSGDIAQQLLMNTGDQLGEKLFVCIMFLDIRDFTPLAEKLSPEELIAYQNNVFGFMIDIIQSNKGNINQLLGDGFMATFGAPISHGNDCQNAYAAALDIIQETKLRNKAGAIPKTKIGIGLHAGFVVTGNVGTEVRKQYSVTGNPVIVASRVEQLNKTYKSQLIITEEVYEKLDKNLHLRQPFLEVEVKGRTNPIKILKIA